MLLRSGKTRPVLLIDDDEPTGGPVAPFSVEALMHVVSCMRRRSEAFYHASELLHIQNRGGIRRNRTMVFHERTCREKEAGKNDMA